VTVGDADLGTAAEAVVLAAREAMINAAKYAGVAAVSVYAEAGDEWLSVFVRDRGVGFDLETATTGRGIVDSIVARMARTGGTARIRSSPGSGTEVELHMPIRQEAAP
jgi:signal transduction histidine kinase